VVIVSCSGKFHAFALAEQLANKNYLAGLYTTYAYQKNIAFRKLVKRIDKEAINPALIQTNIPLAALIKKIPKEFLWNEWYDKWVAKKIAKRQDYKVFIGWSGMSLQSIQNAKANGKLTIVERGSSHILYQNNILKEEYAKFGKNFSIHPKVIEKELKEYEAADYISIPSTFVKKSFIAHGVAEKKLFLNIYGASNYFNVDGSSLKSKEKFIFLYLGALTIQKGLLYLFEAIQQLTIAKDKYEVWFIGTVSEELKTLVDKMKLTNWIFFGQVDHYKLKEYIVQADVAIQPSLQEGLSMVIPQMLSCGVPVIATTNSGGEDLIQNDYNGFIVPIRSSSAIKEKMEYLFYTPQVLQNMHQNAIASIQSGYTWNDYGQRYMEFLNTIQA
jgi:glycosyltransferase involved in cell wall biosynthesis